MEPLENLYYTFNINVTLRPVCSQTLGSDPSSSFLLCYFELAT